MLDSTHEFFLRGFIEKVIISPANNIGLTLFKPSLFKYLVNKGVVAVAITDAVRVHFHYNISNFKCQM